MTSGLRASLIVCCCDWGVLLLLFGGSGKNPEDEERSLFLLLTLALYLECCSACCFKWRTQFEGLPKWTFDSNLQYLHFPATVCNLNCSFLCFCWTILKSFGTVNSRSVSVVNLKNLKMPSSAQVFSTPK